jgi:O-antigen biosynthesis protein
MISVLIPTYERPRHIRTCLMSILQNTYLNYEIILIDQSTSDTTQKIVQSLHNRRIIYLTSKSRNKSRALNMGLNLAKGDIFAFTDDDCIVSNDWLEKINHTFSTNLQISAIFGKTLPYEPKKHKNAICPAIFTKITQLIILKPMFHTSDIGFGNNMTIRKSAIHDIGLFNTHLGPGTLGAAAEDAEMSLRLLIHNYPILYNPNQIVYHNKWLTGKIIFSQELIYLCGEIACYGSFWLRGYTFAKPIIHSNVIKQKKLLADAVKHIMLGKMDGFALFSEFIIRSIYIFRGFSVAIASLIA